MTASTPGSNETGALSGLGLERPRLEAILAEAVDHRLTTIVAGAGAGKTTLLTQWAESRPAAWHTTTTGDSALSVFARRIIDCMRLHAPELSSELLMVLEGAQGPDIGGGGSATRVDFLAADICRNLDSRLQRHVMLVLDDVHLLERGSDSAQFLGALCRHAPARLHIVVASREQIPFPIARMRVEGEVLEISGDDLAFTEAEVNQIITERIGVEDFAWARELTARTGGWPVAAAFAVRARSLEGPTSQPDQSAPEKALFEYLAEEVIGAESPANLETLRRAAELPWVTSELLALVHPGANASSLFEPGGLRERADGPELSLRPLSTYATGTTQHPHSLALTPLVRDFLRSRYPLTDQERSNTLRTASQWYEEQGAFGEALTCLTDADASDDLMRLLSARGDAMLAAGLARRVAGALDGIDREAAPSEILLLEAEALQTLGDWESAMACYERLVPDSEPMPPGLAWRLGFLHHMRGDVETALEIYSRAALGSGDDANEAALLAWTASAHWLRGERKEAQHLAEEALERARASDDSRSLASAHTVLAMVAALSGDRAGNDAHYLRALEHAERARDVLQTIRIRSNRASHFLEEGAYDAAIAELDIALRLADLSGFELWRALALSNRAEVMYHRGRLDEALAQLDESRSIFRSLGSTLEAYPLAQMGDVYLARGDTALARTSYQAAIDLAERPADLQALVPALSGLARVLAEEQPDEAADLARSAAEVDSVLGHVRALLSLAWVARARGDRSETLLHARQAAEVARSRRDISGLGEALQIEASVTEDAGRSRALLEQARNLWEEIGEPLGVARADVDLGTLLGDEEGAFLVETAAESLQRMGAKAASMEARKIALTMARRAPHEIEIKTLGGFAVTREGEAVPSSEWQSRVAREVMWMLLANRGRPIHREILIDRLWPDDDPTKAANRLSVALTTIRNVLDPERTHDSDHYVLTDRETTALMVDNLSVDVETFLVEANRGLGLLRAGEEQRGMAVLQSAESRYVGEFLEEQPYADWAISLREEARAAYLAVGEALAGFDMSTGDHDSAARRYLRMLERDLYNEPAHLGLVSAMLNAGRHGAARRLYGIYASRMAELEVEPASFPTAGSPASPRSSSPS